MVKWKCIGKARGQCNPMSIQFGWQKYPHHVAFTLICIFLSSKLFSICNVHNVEHCEHTLCSVRGGNSFDKYECPRVCVSGTGLSHYAWLGGPCGFTTDNEVTFKAMGKSDMITTKHRSWANRIERVERQLIFTWHPLLVYTPQNMIYWADST